MNLGDAAPYHVAGPTLSPAFINGQGAQSIVNTSSPAEVLSEPVYSQQYAGMIFGWRPPSSCYGFVSRTPQQVDRSQVCAASSNFLPLLIGAALIGWMVRK